jgi:RNA polymerase sigma factor for flagellar operon FliA
MDNKKFKEYDSIDEDKLWERYSKSNEQSIRDYFVLKYAPLVKYVAGKISMGMPQSIEFEDLVSYGIFGLLDAINKFDPSRGIKFKTYAMTRIRGAIFDELRSIDWIPRSIRQKAKQIEQVIAELENKLGRTVEDEEIAKELGITMRNSRISSIN